MSSLDGHGLISKIAEQELDFQLPMFTLPEGKLPFNGSKSLHIPLEFHPTPYRPSLGTLGTFSFSEGSAHTLWKERNREVRIVCCFFSLPIILNSLIHCDAHALKLF